MNSFIFYFFSHVEAYIMSSKDLSMPTWLLRARLVALAVNCVGGNIFIAVPRVMNRAYLAYMAMLWSGFVGLVTSVGLGLLTYKLAREVKRQCVHPLWLLYSFPNARHFANSPNFFQADICSWGWS